VIEQRNILVYTVLHTTKRPADIAIHHLHVYEHR